MHSRSRKKYTYAQNIVYKWSASSGGEGNRWGLRKDFMEGTFIRGLTMCLLKGKLWLDYFPTKTRKLFTSHF